MQQNKKNVSTVKFLSVFGDKIVSGESYNPKDDTCDQRSPVNNPEWLYEQFVVPEDVMDELDAENLEDFEEDIYPYEDRSEMGEDIALAAQLDLKGSKERLEKARQAQLNLSKKSVREEKKEEKRNEDKDVVDSDDDE